MSYIYPPEIEKLRQETLLQKEDHGNLLLDMIKTDLEAFKDVSTPEEYNRRKAEHISMFREEMAAYTDILIELIKYARIEVIIPPLKIIPSFDNQSGFYDVVTVHALDKPKPMELPRLQEFHIYPSQEVKSKLCP